MQNLILESIANNQDKNKLLFENLFLPQGQEKWDEKKKLADFVADIFIAATKKASNKRSRDMLLARAERIKGCADTLLLAKMKSGRTKVERAFLCRDRFCPVCSWRKSLAWQKKLADVLPLLRKKHTIRYIFLTLTVKNCDIRFLRQTIRHMNKAWAKLRHHRQIKRSIMGFFRALEVTKGTNDMAHPHFHVILAVDEGYFDKDKDIYISQAEWAERWKQALQVAYVPVVDVRATYGNDGDVAVEAAKYAVKHDESIYSDPEWFIELVHQMRGFKQYTTGGIIRKAIGEDITEEEMLAVDGTVVSDAYVDENGEIDEVIGYIGYRWNRREKKYVYDPTVTHETFQPPWTIPPF